ncbi:MAG: TPM domain-containing protein [Chlorobi bacterium]|nr:TPM domain-containing protein [Chlorobiota bacterium]
MKKAFRHFISDEQEQLILDAIGRAEKNTSGEIRVHLQRNKPGDVLMNAVETFEALGMHRTALRNAILFYIDIDRKEFAVIGDKGIHEKVGPEFWIRLTERLKEAFSRGDYAGGLIRAIEEAGRRLKEHFPYRPDDVNELPDDISYG